MPCGVIKTQLVKTFTIDLFGADTTEFFGLWQLAFLIKLRWVTFGFMNTPHHKWTVNVTIEEVYDHDLTHARQEPRSITNARPWG
ncbi:hypothetical protein D3C80_2046310 [compost metagenome]